MVLQGCCSILNASMWVQRTPTTKTYTGIPVQEQMALLATGNNDQVVAVFRSEWRALVV